MSENKEPRPCLKCGCTEIMHVEDPDSGPREECVACGWGEPSCTWNERPEEDRLRAEIESNLRDASKLINLIAEKLTKAEIKLEEKDAALDAAREEIERLKEELVQESLEKGHLNTLIDAIKHSLSITKPHPTCETCNIAYCDKERVESGGSGWGESQVPCEHAPIDYCSAHTALKKGNQNEKL
jgi:hypothetical protein